MEDSILKNIKQMLGLEADYNVFDTDIIIHINSALMILQQNSIGPTDGFRIKGSTETWTEFLGDTEKIESAKEFVYIRVKLLFDPPNATAVLEAHKAIADELLWRLREQNDLPTTNNEVNEDE